MIGNVLRYMRRKNKYNQRQIRRIVRVTRNIISQDETDTIQPTFDMIEKIAHNCGYKIYFESLDGKDRFQSKDISRKEIYSTLQKHKFVLEYKTTYFNRGQTIVKLK